MRDTLSQAFQDYLTQYGARNLVTCWRVQPQRAAVLGFTNHTRDLEIDSITYQTILGLEATAVESSEGLDVDSLNITAFLTADNERDLEAGLYDHAQVDIFLVNPYNLAMGTFTLKHGYMGEVTRQDGKFQAEIRGPVDMLRHKIGRVYSTLCDARLGDLRCRVNLRRTVRNVVCDVDGPTNQVIRQDSGSFEDDGITEGSVVTITGSGAGNNVTTTVTAVDPGSFTVTADLAGENDVTLTIAQETLFSDTGTVATVDLTAPRRIFTATLTDYLGNTYPNHWFKEGNLTFLTGDNAGVRRDIRSFVGNTIAFYLEFPFDIEAGDTFDIEVGCDKRPETCKAVFGNFVNFRGHGLFVPTMADVFGSPVHS